MTISVKTREAILEASRNLVDYIEEGGRDFAVIQSQIKLMQMRLDRSEPQ